MSKLLKRVKSTAPMGIGYFMNILSMLNRWIDSENKRGADIPRFTKVQIRKIALFLESHHLFNFNALRKGKAPKGRVKGITGEKASAHYGPDAREIGVLEAGTGPAPVKGRRPPEWDDQVREFKRLVKEENKKLPPNVLDELLE